MKKFNLDPKKFESILTLLILILMVFETFLFINGLLNLNFFLFEWIASFMIAVKDFLYSITLLLFGLFVLAKLS